MARRNQTDNSRVPNTPAINRTPMRTLALILLTISALITAGLIPVTNSLANVTGSWGQPIRLGIFVLCLFRGPALIAAFLLLIGAGRLDSWASSRAGLAALVTIGVIVLEVGSFIMHDLSIAKYLHQPYLLLCAVAATAFPFCVILGGFLSSRTWFAAGVLGALAAGLGSSFVHDPSMGSRDGRGMSKAPAAEYDKVRLTELRELSLDTELVTAPLVTCRVIRSFKLSAPV